MTQRRTITPVFPMVYKPRFGFLQRPTRDVNIACGRLAGADCQLMIADWLKTAISSKQLEIGNRKLEITKCHAPRPYTRRNASQFKDFLNWHTLWMCDSVKPPEARNDKDFAWSNDCAVRI